MYVKLTLRNIRQSARNYWAYCLTIGLTASLVYAFDLLIFTEDIQQLINDFDTTSAFFTAVSVIVAVITMGLVRYATRFMIERRSREFATYLLLGMHKRRICRMFVMENACMGLISLVCGMAVGSLLHQILRSMILNLFQSSYTFQISFSLPALLLTLVYFFIAYLFALHKAYRRLKKTKIHDLMYAGIQREKTPLRHPFLRLAVFLCSLLLLAAGLMELPRIYRSDDAGLAIVTAIFLLVVGIYGLSVGLPSFLEAFSRLPIIRLKRTNLFLIRQITSRANTNGAVMGTVSLLLTIALFCFTVGFGLRFLYPVMDRYVMPFDILLQVDAPSVDFSPALEAIREDCGVSSATEYPLYYSGQTAVQDSLGEAYYHKYLRMSGEDRCVGLSTYNRLRRQLALSEVELEEGGYLIHTQFPEYKELFSQSPVSIAIGGATLRQAGIYEESLGQQYGNNGCGFLLVIPDELCARLSRSSSCLAVRTAGSPTTDLAKRLDQGEYPYGESTVYGGDGVFLDIRTQDDGDRVGYLTLSFSAFYLGIVLLLICATVLSLQQTSEMSAQRFRFSLLRNLGVRESDRNLLALKQLLLLFCIPVAVPAALTPFLIQILIPPGFERMILPAAYVSLLLTYILFLLIYACYFLATYLSFLSSLRES